MASCEQFPPNYCAGKKLGFCIWIFHPEWNETWQAPGLGAFCASGCCAPLAAVPAEAPCGCCLPLSFWALLTSSFPPCLLGRGRKPSEQRHHVWGSVASHSIDSMHDWWIYLASPSSPSFREALQHFLWSHLERRGVVVQGGMLGASKQWSSQPGESSVLAVVEERHGLAGKKSEGLYLILESPTFQVNMPSRDISFSI